MKYLPSLSKENIIDFMTGHPVFRERIFNGKSQFDDKLIQELLQPRNDTGHCAIPVSYYNKIRDGELFQKKIENDRIVYTGEKASFHIQLKPYLKGSITFKDTTGDFRRLFEDNRDFAEVIMDYFDEDLPVIVDEAELTEDNQVILTWHHCHYHDLFHEKHKGYFLIPKSRFEWEYTLHGPAQVYTEALELLHFFQV